ncbi:unnamed protein product [Cuscuta campestris]|uniref:Uncharacterized protein n=1 Tax=Cuscuta campestris TaxID=132261 RepID=A0A484KCZ8_9ASTE|nr:unnamed protein product [Cuscuta campestris]
MASWFPFGRQRRQAPPPPVQPSVTGGSQTEQSATASPRRPPFRPAGAAPPQAPLSPSRKPPSRAASRPPTPSRNGKGTPPLSPSRLVETSPPPPKVENIPPQQPSNERALEEEPVLMEEKEAAPEIRPPPPAGDIHESKLQPPEMTKQSSETTLLEPTRQSSEILHEPTKQSSEILPSETILREPAKQSSETTLLEPTKQPLEIPPSKLSSETTSIEPQSSDPLLMGNNKEGDPQPTTTKSSEPEKEQEATTKQHTTIYSGEHQTIKTVVAETSKDKDGRRCHRGELLAQNRAAAVKEVAVAINVIITLTGENKGAIMQLGRPSNEKPIHIHRAYKPSQPVVDRPTKEEDDREAASASYVVNSNVQGVNNSILVDSHVREMDPGVSVGIPRFPAEDHGKQSDQKPLQETRDGKQRIRRRCLRGLFMEPSDSDSDNNNPEKPRRRRHGCRVPCNDVL